MINEKEAINIVVVVVLCVMGIVVLALVTDVFPEIAPGYDGTFPVGSAPYEYDVNEAGLTNIVVQQKLSDDTWETIDAADYAYVGTTVTVDAGALYV